MTKQSGLSLAISMFLLDAHLDLAMNAMEWNRDLRQPLSEVRKREADWADKPDRGRGVVTFEEMRKGDIGLCVATQIARYVKPSNSLKGWHSPHQAWAQTQAQLAWYRAMEQEGFLRQITTQRELESHCKQWRMASARSGEASNEPTHTSCPIGYVLSLEGADSIVDPSYLHSAHAQGLRAIGLGHYGPGTYAPGTGAEGGLSDAGKDLLKEIEGLGIILDLTHLSDQAFWEAIEIFGGKLWASHCNCRSLIPHQRQLSDEQIKAIAERGGVIGVVLDAWMMHVGWRRGETTPQGANLKLERIVEHIDHMAQLLGNAEHVGIGSDLDGGYGTEQCPMDVGSIADLQKLEGLLMAKGFNQDQCKGVFHENFMRVLVSALPKA